jgi:hypothetical protein
MVAERHYLVSKKQRRRRVVENGSFHEVSVADITPEERLS